MSWNGWPGMVALVALGGMVAFVVIAWFRFGRVQMTEEQAKRFLQQLREKYSREGYPVDPADARPNWLALVVAFALLVGGGCIFLVMERVAVDCGSTLRSCGGWGSAAAAAGLLALGGLAYLLWLAFHPWSMSMSGRKGGRV